MKAKLETNKFNAQDHKLENNYFELTITWILLNFYLLFYLLF